MEKLLTFCVPSYNSEAYLSHALDSLIVGGDSLEVLIIDDGSKDKTLEIAKDYEKRYPDIFKAIHQENKGHGGAINTALSYATGDYFMVLDSDDWVDEKGLHALFECIKKTKEPELILMPYMYRHSYDSEEGRLIRYNHSMKPGVICTWRNVKKFGSSRNLTLHSVIYKTSMLREANIVLPEHCFYEDNYFIYAPLPHVKKLIYIDVPMYKYLLGREGQSMQTETLMKRNENLIRAASLAFNSVDLKNLKKENKYLYRLMKHQLVMMVSSPLLYTSLKEKKISKQEKAAFIASMKSDNLKQYHLLRRHPYVYFPSCNNSFGKASAKVMLWAIRKYGMID